MKSILNVLKAVVLLGVLIVAILIGRASYKIESQNSNLVRDRDSIHRVCRSQLENKVTGKPCPLCRKKWLEVNKQKSLEDRIIEYAELKYGKNVENFTNVETMEVYNMLIN